MNLDENLVKEFAGGGPAKRLRLLTDAGFRDAALAADTGFNLVLAAQK